MQAILNFLQSAAGFVFIFGVVVLVHEMGHFIAAKLTGVYTPRFSVGFGWGPKKRWGETQYQIGVIPLGGYVRMASRDDEATAFLEGGSEEAAGRDAQSAEELPADWDANAMIPFGPKPVPEHRWFESKSVPQRLFILLAGVTMNALLTIAVLFGLNWAVGNRVLETTAVGAVLDMPDSGPLRALLLPGDTIVSVQGTPVANWNDIQRQLLMAPGETLSIGTTRGTVNVPAGSPAGRQRGALMESLRPYAPPIIAAVVGGRPAAVAGVLAGDSIVSIDGRPVRSSEELIDLVSAATDRDISIALIRSGAAMQISLRPAVDTITSAATKLPVPVGRIGVQLASSPQSHTEVGAGEALVLSVQQTGDLALIIVRTLKGLIQNEVSFKSLGGPLEIARASGEAAQAGIIPLLELLALLSINLAVLNLLPIPVLDGGQILILLAESAKGSPFSPKARQVILGTGVALVLLLMLAVSYNDVIRFFGA